MTNLNSILKSRNITLPTKVCLVKTGFSSSHVWMWELDHKEGWALKNCCFQITVLEKTLESPLNIKEIKPVNPKGNQPWILTGKTDFEAEAPILWPSDAKIQFTGKDPDTLKDWGQEEKGATEDEVVGWHRLLWLFCCKNPIPFACGVQWSGDDQPINSLPFCVTLYGKKSACNAGDPGSIPGWGRSHGEGNETIPVSLPGESHGQRSLLGYGPWGHKESDTTGLLTLAYFRVYSCCDNLQEASQTLCSIFSVSSAQDTYPTM